MPNCRAYEYSVVQGATVEPEGVELGDPGAELHIRIELDHCGDRAPTPHSVVLKALGSGAGLSDAGTSTRLFTLEVLEDDGVTFGDETARDGVIDVTIANPLTTDLPASSDITLRFEPRINTCVGEQLELPYRTGARWTPIR